MKKIAFSTLFILFLVYLFYKLTDRFKIKFVQRSIENNEYLTVFFNFNDKSYFQNVSIYALNSNKNSMVTYKINDTYKIQFGVSGYESANSYNPNELASYLYKNEKLLKTVFFSIPEQKEK